MKIAVDTDDCIEYIDCVSLSKGGMIDLASLTLRNIDESLKASLRMRAAENGRSMEEEVRQILKQFLLQKRCSAGIGSRISRRFAAIGGVDLPHPHRSVPRRPPRFSPDDAQ